MLGRLGSPTTLVLCLLAGLLVAGAPPAAAAGEIVVTTTADVLDSGDGLVSLREAVAQANDQAGADTIVLAENAEYVLDRCGVEGSDFFNILEGDLDVTDEASLTVEGHGATIVQTCSDVLFVNAWVFGVLGGDPLWLTDLTIDGVSAAIVSRERALHLERVAVVDSGSGIENVAGDGLALSLVDSTVSDGHRALWIEGDVEMVRSEITQHSGDGVRSIEGDLRLEDSSISDNGSEGIDYVEGDLTMMRSHVDDNEGSGIFEVVGTVTMTDSSASGNGEIGLILASGLRMLRSHLDDNEIGVWVIADSAASPDPLVDVRSSTIAGNSGTGMAVDGGRSVITDSSIAGNGDSAVYALHDSAGVPEIDIVRSTISGNGDTVESEAGGILSPGPVTLHQSTVAGNTGFVGGIEAQSLYADGSTIAGNVGAEIDEVSVDLLTAAGSILGEGVAEARDCEIGDVVFSSFTLYGDPDCLDGATSPDIPPTGDLVGVDPLLGPLADNGGPTSTRLPQAGSPVIDAVSPSVVCSGTDQRGAFRPQGASCDIGSVEVGVVQRFSDVPPSHQFYEEIECLVRLDVTEGFTDGTFRPTLPISRQGVVAWLYRLAGEPEVTGVSPFSDVPASHLFHDAIVWASQEGIADGYADGTFRPGQPVARQGVAAWLWRLEGEPEVDDPPSFSDVPVGSLFEEPIGWLASSGVTEGFTDGTFRPTLPISRQGLAAWICRYEEL